MHLFLLFVRTDSILMMDKGALVEMGSHKELIEMRGRYFALYSHRRLVLTDLPDSNSSPKSDSSKDSLDHPQLFLQDLHPGKEVHSCSPRYSLVLFSNLD